MIETALRQFGGPHHTLTADFLALSDIVKQSHKSDLEWGTRNLGEMVEIVDGLYLGNSDHAMDAKGVLTANGITHLVNCAATQVRYPNRIAANFVSLDLKAFDKQTYGMVPPVSACLRCFCTQMWLGGTLRR